MTAVLRVFSREIYRSSCRRDAQLPYAWVVSKTTRCQDFATDSKVGSMMFNAPKQNKNKQEQRISRLITYISNFKRHCVGSGLGPIRRH